MGKNRRNMVAPLDLAPPPKRGKSYRVEANTNNLEIKTMTPEQKRRQQGETDITDIRQALVSGKTLATATRPLSGMRVLVVVGILTGLYPRSRAKGMEVLHKYYDD